MRQMEGGAPPVEIGEIPETVPLKMDGERMGRALKNILENARKYSPADAEPIHVSLETHDSEINITIQDRGIGIPQEELDLVFEPFYRVDKARTPQRTGFGLGLSLAKNIVDAHGGEIVIHSQPERGTKVIIRLPRNGRACDQ